MIHWPAVAAGGALAVLAVAGLTAALVLLPAREVPRGPEPVVVRAELPTVAEPPPRRPPPPVVASTPEPVRQEPARARAALPREELPPPKLSRVPPQRPSPAEATLRRKQAPPPAAVVSPPPASEPVAAASPTRKRRHQMDEAALRYFLEKVSRELDLEAEKGASAELLARAGEVERSLRPGGKTAPHPVLALAAARADLAGLPLREGSDCRLSRETAQTRQRLARDLHGRFRRLRPPSGGGEEPPDLPYLVASQLESVRSSFETKEAVPVLEQILQPAQEPLRALLVRFLSGIDDPSATAALARRAVFDFSPDVREAALWALQGRRPEDYRETLLAGLRYPWPPVADHAAEALVALGDRGAASDLVGLLDRPDPAAPAPDRGGKLRVPELVRINHLRNCLLCHAPSTDLRDPLPGRVPTPGEPVPELVYYRMGSGTFVRADVTYLRPDFSLLQPVKDHGKWPKYQRFDYVVRRREATREEIERAKQPPSSGTYPQRESVLFALRELTGEDAGTDTAAWQRLVAGEKQKGRP